MLNVNNKCLPLPISLSLSLSHSPISLSLSLSLSHGPSPLIPFSISPYIPLPPLVPYPSIPPSLSLQEFTELYCDKCETAIAKKEDIFSMSVDGPLAAYVNPGGVVHDTLTVLKATNLRKVGSGTIENTWFPGYVDIYTCIYMYIFSQVF